MIRKKERKKERKNDLFIIDKVSMIDCDMLNAIDKIMQDITSKLQCPIGWKGFCFWWRFNAFHKFPAFGGN